MRTLSRLLIAVGLVVLALTFPAKPAESNDCYYCWQEGNCTYCFDFCSGYCIYMCEPGGDGYC